MFPVLDVKMRLCSPSKTRKQNTNFEKISVDRRSVVQVSMVHAEESSSSVMIETSHTLSKDESQLVGDTSVNMDTSFRVIVIFSVIALMLASALVILLPSYLLHVNKEGDAYCMLFFVSLCTSLGLIFLCSVRKVWDKEFNPLHGIIMSDVIKCGFFRAVSGMLIVYSFDQERVPCHIQEFMLSLSVVFLILKEIICFLQGTSRLSRKSMLSWLTLYGGIFFILNLEISNRFKCRGKEDTATHLSQHDYFEVRSIWTLLSAVGVLLLSWNSLRTSSIDVNQVPAYFTKKPHRLALLSIANVVSFLTILCLFWTDLFKTIGKGPNFDSVITHLTGGLRCHFSTAPECSSTVIYGWMFVLCFIFYNFCVWHVYFLTGSKSLPILLSGTGLSLSVCWWNFFELNDKGMEWNPDVGASFCAFIFGAVIVVGSLCVHFKEEFCRMPLKSNADHFRSISVSPLETDI